jgi:hypothetical protein
MAFSCQRPGLKASPGILQGWDFWIWKLIGEGWMGEGASEKKREEAEKPTTSIGGF